MTAFNYIIRGLSTLLAPLSREAINMSPSPHSMCNFTSQKLSQSYEALMFLLHFTLFTFIMFVFTYLSLWDEAVILNESFLNSYQRYLEPFPWNCPSVNVTKPHWWIVKIGSGNGLVLWNYYLNQWWPSSSTHTCYKWISRPGRINTLRLRRNCHHFEDH